eukprot:scaffold370_cov176-Amphora_coffeaeformis.AAC.28
MDVVWLKKDVRLHDHGPLSTAMQRKDRLVLILYVYESDQLSESSVHGSHIAFANEGLLDLEKRLCQLAEIQFVEGRFQILTLCHGEIVATLTAIHECQRIGRLMAHMETGHMASFERDKRVRKWCKNVKIPFVEMQQTGVTRCLTDRDKFSVNLKKFMERPLYSTPKSIACRLVRDLDIPGRTKEPLFDELIEIPDEHRVDRAKRQVGGEEKALSTLQSFLQDRGKNFSKGISSPNSSWSSCSRLSPYLTWGHISLRYVVQSVKKKQEENKRLKSSGQTIDPGWARSLTAFLSRLHWRSHFIQKLETEPEMEKRDLCGAYQHLRRQPGDWNEDFYRAWKSGNTGFPFVDACMRCLHAHGWLNFRMRAMLVSFASYNLWLDWKRLAPHLARVFLDYEPGIHYPQLQMQSGTTGINAMRVYSVTKQGKDQDPKAFFIRKYVPELHKIPDKYIHEPWKTPMTTQEEVGVHIGIDYPKPIVNEQESAKLAKQRVSEIRKQDNTKKLAQQVYRKHGSRSSSRPDGVPCSPAKKAKTLHSQPSIKSHFSSAPKPANNISPLKIQEQTPDQTDCRSETKQWSCAACTFLNQKSFAIACEICGTEKPQ